LLTWYGIHSYRKLTALYALASSSWLKTSATVVDAQLVDHEEENSEGYDTTWYEPRLVYSYAVAGDQFEGQRTALGTALKFSVFASAQKWLLAHAPGSTIDLWYDPARPSESTPMIDKSGHGGAIVTTGMGMAFLLFGAVVMARLI
jgi:hypothetical protein